MNREVRRKFYGSKSAGVRLAGIPLYFCLSLIAIFASPQQSEIPPHDEMPRDETKFTLARFSYSIENFRFSFRGWGPLGDHGPPWSHDWPESEEHLMKILSEVTRIDVNPGGHIISFEDEDCFIYPIAYFAEVGYLSLSDKGAANMREYLLRGGFLIVDDFRRERELANFRYQMSRVFPDRPLEEIPRTDPIWTCFYDISKLEIIPPYGGRYQRPQYFGIRDDRGRLMMVVNYNNDISDYWQWSNDPWQPIELTNEAYKYGVNYVMYALTH